MRVFRLSIIFLIVCLSARSQVNTDQVMRIGQNALYFEDYMLSIQYFNLAIQSEPNQAIPYFYRAIAKFNLEDFIFNSLIPQNSIKKSRKFEIIKERTVEINQLEEKADKVFEKAIKNLYSKEKNAIEVLRWTEMFKCLEDTIDACEHIADCVEDIIMKNS